MRRRKPPRFFICARRDGRIYLAEYEPTPFKLKSKTLFTLKEWVALTREVMQQRIDTVREEHSVR